MPRKDYKTITVKLKTFVRFTKSVKDAKDVHPKTNNSSFLDHLLELHRNNLGTWYDKKS